MTIDCHLINCQLCAWCFVMKMLCCHWLESDILTVPGIWFICRDKNREDLMISVFLGLIVQIEI